VNGSPKTTVCSCRDDENNFARKPKIASSMAPRQQLPAITQKVGIFRGAQKYFIQTCQRRSKNQLFGGGIVGQFVWI